MAVEHESPDLLRCVEAHNHEDLLRWRNWYRVVPKRLVSWFFFVELVVGIFVTRRFACSRNNRRSYAVVLDELFFGRQPKLHLMYMEVVERTGTVKKNPELFVTILAIHL